MPFALKKSGRNLPTVFAVVSQSHFSQFQIYLIFTDISVEAHRKAKEGGGFLAAQTLQQLYCFALLSVFLFIPNGVLAQKESLDQRLQQAVTLIQNNQLAAAEQQLNIILQTSPNQAQALNLLGTIRASQGKLSDAEALFTRAVRSDNQLTGAHMNLAYLYLLKNMPEKTIAELKEVLNLEANHTEALYKLGRLLLSQGRIDDCITTLETFKQAQSIGSAVILGDAYVKKGDINKAEESYLTVLSKQSDAADAVIGMAQVSYLKGDEKATGTYLFRAKGVIGNSPDLLYKYALVALKSGIYEEARAALEQAIKLKADEAAYFLVLGATWLKKPDLFEAERAFRRALQLQPESPQGQMYLGYTLLKQKKYPEARTCLEKSVKADSGLPEPFYYLGLIAQEENDDERAVVIFEKVIQQFPAFNNAHLALGSSYLKLKNYARARQELELAAKLNPDEPKAHYNLALLYARLKEPERAQQEMQIVEKLKSKGEAKESDLTSPSVPPPTR